MALAEPIAPYVVKRRRARRFAACPPLAVREVAPPGAARPRLLDRVRAAVRTRHYGHRTEKAYVAWVRRHPLDMGGPEVAKFLTSLAMEGQVAASTQNQALSALLFLCAATCSIQIGREERDECAFGQQKAR